MQVNEKGESVVVRSGWSLIRVAVFPVLLCGLCGAESTTATRPGRDVTTSSSSSAGRAPNIVLILADDLGWKDTGYQGSDFYETPNIDRLADDGVVFPNAYACGANCAPSRACLLSGQYTPRHGVFAVDSTERGPVNLMRLVPVPNKSGLAPENVTIADMLKTQGYATGIFGKWHLGGKDGAPPAAQGFDVVMDPAASAGQASADDEADSATLQSDGPARARSAQGRRPGRGGRAASGREDRTGPPAAQTSPSLPANQGRRANTDPKGIFAITRAACKFMETNRDRPFFAYVAHHAVHVPLQARPETITRFSARSPGKQHTNVVYAACTYDFDEGVGILLKKLGELGLDKNTLVILTSDNGGTPTSPQEPLRGNKGCYYEGGVRVPFIARWPGLTKPGTRCDVPVVNVDLFPTFAAAAGAKLPNGKPLDGENLMPLLRGVGSLSRKAVFWHFPGYLDRPVIRGRDPVFRTRPVSVIRKGDWKLLLYHEEWLLDEKSGRRSEQPAAELYNLATDPGERVDLGTSEPARRKELLGDLKSWIESVKAPFPTQPNPIYDPKARSAGRPASALPKD